MVKEIGPQEFLKQRAEGRDMTLLDVREDWEIELAPVPAVLIHIPMGQVADRMSELDPHKETVVICRSGGRSLQVARFLEAQGFAAVFNLSGGILAWSRDVDPQIPQY
ncbi:MAG: rhodanese-like domain-containing protein [Steroidobacteraceae bacterium]|jgi:rhodanese-related sulfurtransferase